MYSTKLKTSKVSLKAHCALWIFAISWPCYQKAGEYNKLDFPPPPVHHPVHFPIITLRLTLWYVVSKHTPASELLQDYLISEVHQVAACQKVI